MSQSAEGLSAVMRRALAVPPIMAEESSQVSRAARPPGNLEREESKLWRLLLLFMVLLAAGFAALAWERLENLPYHLGALAVGTLALAVLFAVYAYGRRREVSELKTLLHGLQEHVGGAPSQAQLAQIIQTMHPPRLSSTELLAPC